MFIYMYLQVGDRISFLGVDKAWELHNKVDNKCNKVHANTCNKIHGNTCNKRMYINYFQKEISLYSPQQTCELTFFFIHSQK